MVKFLMVTASPLVALSGSSTLILQSNSLPISLPFAYSPSPPRRCRNRQTAGYRSPGRRRGLSPCDLVAASAPLHADAPSLIAATTVTASLRLLRRHCCLQLDVFEFRLGNSPLVQLVTTGRDQSGVQPRECARWSVQVRACCRIHPLELHDFKTLVVVFEADDEFMLTRKFHMLREPCENSHRAMFVADPHNFGWNHGFGRKLVLQVQAVVGRDYFLGYREPRVPCHQGGPVSV